MINGGGTGVNKRSRKQGVQPCRADREKWKMMCADVTYTLQKVIRKHRRVSTTTGGPPGRQNTGDRLRVQSLSTFFFSRVDTRHEGGGTGGTTSVCVWGREWWHGRGLCDSVCVRSRDSVASLRPVAMNDSYGWGVRWSRERLSLVGLAGYEDFSLSDRL